MKLHYETQDGNNGEINAEFIHIYPYLAELVMRGGPVSLAGFNKLNQLVPDDYISNVASYRIIKES